MKGLHKTTFNLGAKVKSSFSPNLLTSFFLNSLLAIFSLEIKQTEDIAAHCREINLVKGVISVLIHSLYSRPGKHNVPLTQLISLAEDFIVFDDWSDRREKFPVYGN